MFRQSISKRPRLGDNTNKCRDGSKTEEEKNDQNRRQGGDYPRKYGVLQVWRVKSKDIKPKKVTLGKGNGRFRAQGKDEEDWEDR